MCVHERGGGRMREGGKGRGEVQNRVLFSISAAAGSSSHQERTYERQPEQELNAAAEAGRGERAGIR